MPRTLLNRATANRQSTPRAACRVGRLRQNRHPLGADEFADRVGDVPDVHVHAREDPAVLESEGDELLARYVAPEDHPAVATGLDVAGVTAACLGVELAERS